MASCVWEPRPRVDSYLCVYTGSGRTPMSFTTDLYWSYLLRIMYLSILRRFARMPWMRCLADLSCGWARRCFCLASMRSFSIATAKNNVEQMQ